MSFDTENIIKVASELKKAQGDLREAQDRVRQLEMKLRNLTTTHTGSVTADAVLLSSLAGVRSTPEKIISLLTSNPDKSFSFKEIHKMVGGNEASIRALLARLVKEGRIGKRGWGEYVARSGESKEKGPMTFTVSEPFK